MWIWLVILVLTLAASGLGVFYLLTRFRRFSFAAALARRKKIFGWLCSVGMLVVLTVALILAMDTINAIVCLLHLVAFWLICDGAALLVRNCTRKKAVPQQETPKRYYAGLAAIVLTIGYLSAGWYYAHHVQQTSYTITTEKSVGSLRIVQFADSHMGATFHAAEFAGYLDEINALNPDVVLITGDFADDGTSREDLIESCAALRRLHPTYGVYFSYGNHDRGYYSESTRGWSSQEFAELLTQNGVTILQDEHVVLDNRFCILGREDLSAESRLPMDALVADIDPALFTIVMDHQPHDYDAQAASGVDLVLSGHTHGGQLLPITYVGEWLGMNCRTYGYEQREQTSFLVTSGIADWAIQFKTGCVAEYVVIDVQS